jgi:hypothetical protein
MTTPILGPQPAGFRINLPADADFVGEVVSDGDPFDPDTLIQLRFTEIDPAVVWTAEIDTNDNHIARWTIDEEDVAALIAAGPPTTCRLHYELGIVDLLWDTARVKVV